MYYPKFSKCKTSFPGHLRNLGSLTSSILGITGALTSADAGTVKTGRQLVVVDDSALEQPKG